MRHRRRYRCRAEVAGRRQKQPCARQGRKSNGERNPGEQCRRRDLCQRHAMPIIDPRTDRAGRQQVGADSMGDRVGQEGADGDAVQRHPRAGPAQADPLDDGHQGETGRRKDQRHEHGHHTPAGDGMAHGRPAQLVKLAPEHPACDEQ